MNTITPIKSLLVIICLLLSFNLQAQDVPPATINVATAGTLPSLIASTKKYQITNLTLTGNLNGTDICYIREMAGSDVEGKNTAGKLSVLDLSGANIVYNGSYYYDNGTHYYTSLNQIGDYTFSGCIGLTSVTIPNSVTSIIGYAFTGCSKLKEFIVSENNTTYTSVEGVLFSKECTELIAYPNAKSNIYTIPNSVISIGDNAFQKCTELTSVTIGNSVTSIGDYVFFGCTRITEIHCKALTPPNATSNTFYQMDKTTCKLYVPKGTYANYWIATGWGDFTNIIEEESTAISQTKASNIKVYTEQDAIVIKGAKLGAEISVYTESGALLQTTKVTNSTIRIAVPVNHTYLVKASGKTFKIAL